MILLSRRAFPLLCSLILSLEMRLPSIDIYHRIWNPPMDEKVELQTPLAFARKHLESSAIYGWCLTRTLSHSLLDFIRPSGPSRMRCGKEEGFLSTIKKFAIVNQAVAKNKEASQDQDDGWGIGACMHPRAYFLVVACNIINEKSGWLYFHASCCRLRNRCLSRSTCIGGLSLPSSHALRFDQGAFF